MAGLLPDRNEALTAAVADYLDLVSAEYRLVELGLLRRKIWRIWKPDIQEALRGPLIGREWPALSSRFDSHGKFKDWVSQEVGAAALSESEEGSHDS